MKIHFLHMPTPARQLFFAALVLFCIQRSAGAHDIGASNATFWVRATGIDAELYMGLNAGALLIANAGELVVITPNTFPDFLDRLQAAGSALFTLKAPDGTTLKPDAVSVSMTDQIDVRYDLHYPLPPALPGTLRIHADYLKKMVDGHIGTIYVMNAIGDHYGLGEVRAESPDIQAHLPAADALTNAHPAAVTPLAPSPSESHPSAPWFLWAILGSSALLIVIVALRGITRQNVHRNMSD